MTITTKQLELLITALADGMEAARHEGFTEGYKIAREELEEAFREANREDIDAAYDEGYGHGFSEGTAAGYSDGAGAGYDDGYTDGYKDATDEEAAFNEPPRAHCHVEGEVWR